MSAPVQQSRGRKRGKFGRIKRREASRLVTSTEIAIAKAEPLILAEAHAASTGRRLNRFVTIAFAANLCPMRTIEALGLYLKAASDWLNTQGVPLVCIWVIENPAHKDEHVHLLIHLPTELEKRFSELQRGWIARTGTRWGKGVVKSKCVYDSREARAGIVRYMLKGCDAEAAKDFRVIRTNEGAIEGKRCGFSESLGPTARWRENGVVGASERPQTGKRPPGRSRETTRPTTAPASP
ncbi:MAG: hypothetical protein DHS20C03_15890 [Minwuia thermotolerans]|nr:MAG: hypothetical protein DHS20C03_15890 [Minwuia thermotolerans]